LKLLKAPHTIGHYQECANLTENPSHLQYPFGKSICSLPNLYAAALQCSLHQHNLRMTDTDWLY
jgi:hypothetical protein